MLSEKFGFGCHDGDASEVCPAGEDKQAASISWGELATTGSLQSSYILAVIRSARDRVEFRHHIRSWAFGGDCTTYVKSIIQIKSVISVSSRTTSKSQNCCTYFVEFPWIKKSPVLTQDNLYILV